MQLNIRFKLVAGLFLIASVGVAQERTIASIVVIQPKEGMQKQFDEGYKRHLEWHRKANDPWVWYGWQIVSGDRLFSFVDATAGRAWEDFDGAVNPAGDAADNAVNVMPYANFVSRAFYELQSGVSSSRLLEEHKPSPVVDWSYYDIYPGKEKEFAMLLRSCHEALQKAGSAQSYTWYKLVTGGDEPAYLLMAPMGKISDIRAATVSPLEAWVTLLPQRESEQLAERIRSTVRGITTETLRYRADMSIVN